MVEVIAEDERRAGDRSMGTQGEGYAVLIGFVWGLGEVGGCCRGGGGKA